MMMKDETGLQGGKETQIIDIFCRLKNCRNLASLNVQIIFNNIMKRIFAILASAALVASLSVANAQKKDFDPYWFMQIQGGAAHTIGETSFGDLISPSAAVSFGYQFSPVFGARLNVNGWQAKGAVNGPTTVYKFNYIEGAADLMVDVASIFAGYKFDRTLNPYIFGGVGVNYAFNNDEANDAKIVGKFVDGYLWDGSKVSPAFRAGAVLTSDSLT